MVETSGGSAGVCHCGGPGLSGLCDGSIRVRFGSPGAYNLPQWVEILLGRAYDGLNYYVTMSGFGFVFFAGIKCLLPEKR